MTRWVYPPLHGDRVPRHVLRWGRSLGNHPNRFFLKPVFKKKPVIRFLLLQNPDSVFEQANAIPNRFNRVAKAAQSMLKLCSK